LMGGEANRLDRGDGLLLLLLFALFLYYLVADMIKAREQNAAGEQGMMNVWVAAVLIAAGLAGLVLGAHLTVTGAVGLARSAGVPEVIIGLTLVAVGTSLPELATSLVAARQGQTDIAVGNIVGSNIFNLAFILGLTATIKPMPVPPGGLVDVCVMMGFAVLLLPMAMTRQSISRAEGAVLLALYIGYISWLAIR